MKIQITTFLHDVIKQQLAASSCKHPSYQNIQGNCINHWLHINKFIIGGLMTIVNWFTYETVSLSLRSTVISPANLHNFTDLIKIPSILGWIGPATQAHAAQGDRTLTVRPSVIQKVWAHNAHIRASLLLPSASWAQQPAALLREGQTSNVRPN